VIEHVHQPARFLARCRDILNPGGRILISTGNANAPSFRFMGAGYWYCSVAEHISFISPRWCQRISTLLGLTVEKQAKFSHGRQRQARFPIEILANAVYRMSPGLFSGLRRLGFGDKDVRTHQELAIHPPSWISAKDHFIVLFRKN
jgi:2-polyprenyl-3-methyl-5-hydroxy-6-metoxy-1,4-benzoquinol methylase